MRANKARAGLLVGLTGGFGTGKSTVARFFKELGAQVIDSDRIAHQALKPETSTYDAIRDHFRADDILGKKGVIDRKKLARIVFERPGKRKTLEAIIHPYVFSEITRIAKRKSGIWVLEVPLLFETHFNEKMDVNIVVRASEKNQIARFTRRGGRAAQVRVRNRAQMSLQRKAGLADFVIGNDGSRSETRKQVLKIWNQLKSMMRGEKKNG